ncbi:hypothetical protein MATL_G00039780 [Megalops atlanticus]|uniref:Ig-like domain-containing protein n=1 Tax=Megalops atlanticus TaxID=7932 RepID=A0A9D3Q9E8_MEGAT|nr:hypothetical protein MATL_G00039780 [Megalops atlanticus]
MDIATSRKLGTLVSLAFLWLFPGVMLEVHIPQKKIEVINGKMVVLQAWYSKTDNFQKNTVLWNFMSNNTKLIISNTAGEPSFGSPEFHGRVGFLNPMPSNNLTIFINNTQESDSGRYVCMVLIPNGRALTGEITLDVKVPPSIPVCKMEGKPVLKGNVTLTCKSKAGKPVPIYKWSKTTPVNEVFFSPMLNEKLGTLKLNNLTKNMTGKYVCKASNTAGSESCYINLEITTPATNVGVIAGATIGSVVGLVAIVMFLILILRRKSDTEDDMANDIKEDAQAPKRVSWAKSGTGSDIISKNGTLSSITTSPHPRDHHYTHHPASDTASIITATGSTMGYRPRPRESTPPQGLPGYQANTTLPRGPPGPPSTNGSTLHRPDSAQPQAPRPPPLPANVTSSNIARMGGVPIMVPAQNQAGSLV